jgi:hypothetical protein
MKDTRTTKATKATKATNATRLGKTLWDQGFDGPGRPTLEAAGAEDSERDQRQTLQFGARNDAWIAWEECLVEFKYIMIDKDNDFDVTLARMIQAVDSYLALAPPQDVKQAKERLLYDDASPL